MTAPLEEVIAQNNETVAFINSQDLSSALNSSIVAMELIRIIDSSNNQSTTQSSTNIAVGSLDACIYHSGIDTSFSLDGDSSSSRNQYMYDQGIRIPLEVNDLTTVTAILVFNAALAHHLQSRRNNNAHKLQRAQQLYELLYESYNMDDNVLFQFMVINNIAVIQQSTGNVAGSFTPVL